MFQFANNENNALAEPVEATERKQNPQFNNIRTERPKFCIHCGARLEDENDFCTECGAKIEAEVFESEENAENCENQSESTKQKYPVPAISSDRMASIAETTARKFGAKADEFKKLQQTSQTEKGLTIQSKTASSKNKLINAMYVHKDSQKTMYLEIQNVNGKNVRASIKTLFSNGGYATEIYMGTIDGDEISLTISDYDLHPLPKETQTSYSETSTKISVHTRTTTHNILVGTSFSGIVTEDTISGTFSGEFTGFCVFRRV